MTTVCKVNIITIGWTCWWHSPISNQLSCVAIVQVQCHILNIYLGLQSGKSQLKKSLLTKKDCDTDRLQKNLCLFWNHIQCIFEVIRIIPISLNVLERAYRKLLWDQHLSKCCVPQSSVSVLLNLTNLHSYKKTLWVTWTACITKSYRLRLLMYDDVPVRRP